nr:hypothetical protein GCM10025732_05970 [Glycomyces mayteni]
MDEDGVEELVLRAEDPVDALLVDARGLGDAVDARARQAALGELLAGGAQEGGAGGVGALGLVPGVCGRHEGQITRR